MKGKGRSRLVEWGKSLLIVVLVICAVYQLGRTQFSGGITDGVRDLLDRDPVTSTDPASTQPAPSEVHPVRLAICQEGQRYGVQYDQEETDGVFSSLSTLFYEALGSADTPQTIQERDWRKALRSTGIYLDFYYPMPLLDLSGWLGGDHGNSALTGTARRICLASDENGGVSLFYINEEDGCFYASATTLTLEFHLNEAVANLSPNGAMFAFEISGMESMEPYTLLTSTPEPVIYATENPLLEDSGRIGELLSTLSFQARGTGLDPAVGGPLVEGNDSLRLFDSGLLTFHTIGDSDFRFQLSENSIQGALDYTQALAEDTVGAWCGAARLSFAGMEETADGLEIVFQYTLNGVPVVLPKGNYAARFVVRSGAVTDFSLYLRSYTDTGETSQVLPELQAAAAMGAMDARGKELMLLYRDSGGELVSAGWVAD